MALQLTPFQKSVLAASDDADIVYNLGGRGSGKTFLNIMGALRHADRYRGHARILFVRRTQNALAELEDTVETVVIQAYGRNGYIRNRNSHEVRLNTGAVLRFECVDALTPQTLARLVGQSVSFLVIEEAGQYADEKIIDQLFSNLRAPDHVRVQCWMSANPGGPGAHHLRRRTLDQGAKPLEAYTERETGLRCVYSLSTFADNTKLDTGYEQRLRASVASDPALQAAWIDGSFERVSGAFLGDLFDPAIHVLDPWPHIPGNWDIRLGIDNGGISPTLAELVLIARDRAIGADGRAYPKGSAVVIGEVSTAIPPSLSQGDGSSPADIAARIFAELFDPFEIKPRNLKVAAIDPNASVRAAGKRSFRVIDEYAEAGLRLRSADRQNRPARLLQIRSLLDGAVKGDRPGLWICRNCENLVQVLPTIQRSTTRIDDIDPRAPKHSLDAMSYALSTPHGYRTRQYDGYGARDAPYTRAQRRRDERNAIIV